ncbi:hypothetical protein OROMI_005846 [Orobanche minor]
MVFTPFTGKDNHGRCVTFGAALLTSEDTDSYTWLLEKFKECMKTLPKMIITDQDPALKIAVEHVMPDTNHRFCMWHIMKKVAKKIPVSLTENEGFSKKFNDIVWSETIQPVDFEIQWNEVIEEYGLLDIDWFATMFELREFWIPAYFKDVPMAGLFRTTSMSESENSFFQRYNNRNANLLTFMMHFDSAIDAQRDAHDKLSSVDEGSVPKTRNDCLFEKHAAAVYTTNIFQNIVFKVEVTVQGETYDCECKHFYKHGLLCRHIYVVLKNDLVRVIPEKYIVSRWTRYACLEDYTDGQDMVSNGEKSTEGNLEKLYFLHMLNQSSKMTIGYVGGHVDKMKELLEDFNALKLKYKNGDNDTDKSSKEKGFEKFYGASIPEHVHVLPPDPVKTKGSGSGIGDRMKSQREKAINDANKKKRKCRKCGQLANHDSRNCPLVV